jgi:hypothetical protein
LSQGHWTRAGDNLEPSARGVSVGPLGRHVGMRALLLARGDPRGCRAGRAGERNGEPRRCFAGRVTGLRAYTSTEGCLVGREMNSLCLRRRRSGPQIYLLTYHFRVVTRSIGNRLETRAKEPTGCASVLVIETKQRIMKVSTCEPVVRPLTGRGGSNSSRSGLYGRRI